MDKNLNMAWAEIDLKAIQQNYDAIEKLAASQFERPKSIHGVRVWKIPYLLPVVKAEAYGHGMPEVAKTLDDWGNVQMFAVSDVVEGIELRKSGICKDILLLESPLPESAKEIIFYDLTPSLSNWSQAVLLNDHATSARKIIDVHIKIDTGMGRLGVWHEEAEKFVKKVMTLSHLSIKGLFTHFPLADTNKPFTQKQIDILYNLVNHLDEQGLIIPYVHAANSMGIGSYKTNIFNLARPGLMLYGLYPSDTLKKKIVLKPAMSIKSRILFVKEIPAKRGVSYGHAFVAKKKMTIATLPIGYSDGYFRTLSNKASVLIKGKRCPVIGRVTMDQIMVDVSRVPNVKAGMIATIMGRDGKETVSADELAHLAGTISYEVVCSLGNRLPRVYSKI